MSGDRLRLESLSVLGGPLHGRRYSPEEVVGEVLIGSDSSCHLVLDLPTISPIHAKIWTDLGNSRVKDTSAPRGVFVNTERVESETRIDDGDVLWLGPPQEAGSVCLRLLFKEWVEQFPGMAAEEAPAPPAEAEPQDRFLPEAPVDAAVGAEEAAAGSAGGEQEFEESSFGEPEAAPASHEDPFFVGGPPDAASEPAFAPAAEVPPQPSVAHVPEAPAEHSAELAAAAAPSLEVPSAPVDAVVEPEPAHAPSEEAAPAFVIGNENDGFAVEPPHAEATPEPAPQAVIDEWAISEPVSEPAPEPAPATSPADDEFFVAADAGETAAPAEAVEAAFVVPEPESPAPGFVDAAFLDLPPLEPTGPPPSPEPTPPPAAAPVAASKPPAPPAPTKPASAPATAPPPTPAPAAASTAPASETPAAAAKPAARPAEGEPRAAATAPRAQPAARRPSVSSAARRPAGARPGASPRPAKGGGAGWVRPAGLGAAGLLVVAALGFGALKLFGGAPLRLDGIEPKRVRVGQRATLTGSGFGSAPAAQTVMFGDRAAKVVQAAPGRLEIEVPEAALSGDEGRLAVTVRAGSRTSAPVEVTVYQGPRLHGLSPGAAMPGEEVVLAGSGWGIGATVRFGQMPAQTLDVQSTQIRVLVPEVGGPGTEAAVVVTVAGVDSNSAPFVVGHQPAAPAAPAATPEPAPTAAAATPAPAPTPTPAPAATPTPTPTPPPLQLDGNWAGSQVEQSQRTYLTVLFRGSGGSVAYEGGITFTVPMLSVEKPRRDQVHFSVQIRGGLRHYSGQWNGEAIAGSVSTDAAGKNVVATFELRKR